MINNFHLRKYISNMKIYLKFGNLEASNGKIYPKFEVGRQKIEKRYSHLDACEEGMDMWMFHE